jgi:hypothetical protein
MNGQPVDFRIKFGGYLMDEWRFGIRKHNPLGKEKKSRRMG